MSKPPKNALPLYWYFGAGYGECYVKPFCQRGEWICWARRGSRDGPWSQVPTSAWPYIRMIDKDVLCQQELREERVKLSDPRHRGAYAYEERLRTVEMWFDPWFAPAATSEPARTHYFAPLTVKAYVRDQYLPSLNGRTPNIDEMMSAVRATYPGVTREFVRQLKAKYAPGSRGRPKKSSG